MIDSVFLKFRVLCGRCKCNVGEDEEEYVYLIFIGGSKFVLLIPKMSRNIQFIILHSISDVCK